MLLIRLITALSLVGLMISAASAQTPVRVRGTVEALDGNQLTVASRDGDQVRIKLADDYTVAAVVPADLESITTGNFIGTAAMKQPDGSFRALEVLVFPEAMRGTGEGHYPWDLAPESTMTNATVAAVVAGASGRELTLAYKGENVRVTVPPGVPVVTFVPGDRGLLTRGAKIFVGATKAADGTLSAGRVAVGKDGLTPPM